MKATNAQLVARIRDLESENEAMVRALRKLKEERYDPTPELLEVKRANESLRAALAKAGGDVADLNMLFDALRAPRPGLPPIVRLAAWALTRVVPERVDDSED